MNFCFQVGAQAGRAHLGGRGQIAPPRGFASALRYPVSGFRYLLVLLLPFAICRAAPTAAMDLGQNLSYVRLHKLPDDARILSTAWSAPALVVDLRYPTVDGTPALPADLPARPPAAPLFVLVGPDTPAGVLASLRASAPALITLGLPAPNLTPDIPLSVGPAADRRAYDALEAGAPVESLINVKIKKERFDEAALTREHAEDLAGAAPPAPPPAAPPPPAAAPGAPATPAPPPPPVDVVLQRAVQLDRALLALDRLPAE